MDPTYIKPFISSIQNVFSTMLQLPVTVKEPVHQGREHHAYDVSGIIGMTGDVIGSRRPLVPPVTPPRTSSPSSAAAG